MQKQRIRSLAVTAVVLVAGFLFFTSTSYGRSTQFVVGGALVNLGYRMQDHLEAYDFEHEDVEDLGPEEVWQEMLRQNRMAASVRRRFPRTVHHPLVALVACMDARIDTNELTGDTRRWYYVIRTAGSVLDDKEIEMLELAVANGIKLIVFTTHTQCAAEGVAADAGLRRRYPALSHAVDQRALRVDQLLARPAIAARIAGGELAVKRMAIDTETEALRSVPGSTGR